MLVCHACRMYFNVSVVELIAIYSFSLLVFKGSVIVFGSLRLAIFK